jgi:hypothetical protein
LPTAQANVGEAGARAAPALALKEYYEGDGHIVQCACERGCEGIASKRFG